MTDSNPYFDLIGDEPEPQPTEVPDAKVPVIDEGNPYANIIEAPDAPGVVAFDPTEPEQLTEEQIEAREVAEDERLRSLFAILDRGHSEGRMVNEIAEATGSPVRFVEANLDEFAALAEEMKFDPRKWRKDHPYLYEMVTKNPEAFDPIIQDEKISWLSRALGGAGAFLNDVSTGNPLVKFYARRERAKQLGLPFNEQSPVGLGVLDPEKNVEYEEAATAGLTGIYSAAPIMEAFADALGGIGAAYKMNRVMSAEGDVDRIKGVMDQLGPNNPSIPGLQVELKKAKELAVQRRRDWLETKQQLPSKPKAFDVGPVGQLFVDATQGVSSQVAVYGSMGTGALVGAAVGTAAGAVLKKPGLGRKLAPMGAKIATFGSSFFLERGAEYEAMEKLATDSGEEVDRAKARGWATLYALTAAGIETGAEFGIVLRSMGRAGAALRHGDKVRARKEAFKNRGMHSLLKRLGRNALFGVGGQGAEEGLQEATAITMEWAARTHQAGESQSVDLQEAGKRIGQSIYLGALGGGVMTAPMTSVDVLTSTTDHLRSTRAAAQASRVLEVMDTDLGKNMPKEVSDWLVNSGKDADRPIENVYIVPDKLREIAHELGMSPEDAATKLMGEGGPARLQKAFDMAQRTERKAVLRVGINDFVRNWAEKPITKALLGHMTTVENGHTEFETAQLQLTAVKRFEEKHQELLDANQETRWTPTTPDEQVVYSAVEETIRESAEGLVEQEQIDGAVATERAVLETFAERTGVPVGEMYAMRARELSFDRTSLAAVRADFNVMNIPQQRDAYFTDIVTGLLNRRGLEAAPRDPERPMMAIWEVEGFKAIQDEFGHDTGDAMLRVMGNAARANIPDASKSGARVEGFVRDQAHADQIAADMEAALGGPGRVLAAVAEATDSIDESIGAAATVMDTIKKTEREKGAFSKRGERPVSMAAIEKAEGSTQLQEFSDRLLHTEDQGPIGLAPAHERSFEKIDSEEAFETIYREPGGLLTEDGYRRALALNQKQFKASADLRGLQVLNRNFGRDAGTSIIGLFGRVMSRLNDFEYDPAHLHGDEYAAQHNDSKELQAYFNALRKLTDKMVLYRFDDDGSVLLQKGLYFVHGIAETYDKADRVELARNKKRQGDVAEPERIPAGKGLLEQLKELKDRGAIFVDIGELASRGRQEANERGEKEAGAFSQAVTSLADEVVATAGNRAARTAALKDPTSELARHASRAHALIDHAIRSDKLKRRKVGGLDMKVANTHQEAFVDIIDASYQDADNVPSEQSDAAFFRGENPPPYPGGLFDGINDQLGIDTTRGEPGVSGLAEAFVRLLRKYHNGSRNWSDIAQVIDMLNDIDDIELRLPDQVAENLAIAQEEAALQDERIRSPEELAETIDDSYVDDDGDLIDKDSGETIFQSAVKERLYQGEADPKNLVVLHNLSAENLLHADELGALPAPSLAVSRKEHPITGFGEITLIGDPGLIDPKTGTPVFDADIYSPRFPRARFSVKSKGLQKLSELLGNADKNTDLYLGDATNELEQYGPDGILKQPRWRAGLGYAFLQEKGKTPETVMKPPHQRVEFSSYPSMLEFFETNESDRGFEFGSQYHKDLTEAATKALDQYRNDLNEAAEGAGDSFYENRIKDLLDEDGLLRQDPADRIHEDAVRRERGDTVDKFSTSEAVLKTIDSNKRTKNQFEKWAKEKLEPVFGDKFIQKFVDHPIDGPRRRKIPYTLTNILRELTKKIRAGEDFNYGLGTARSLGAEKFTSLEDVQAARDRITSEEEFDKAKEELDKEFFALSDKFGRYHEGSTFQLLDALSTAIGDSFSRSGGMARQLRENGFKGVPRALQAELGDFAASLLAMPTKYFEAKPQRAVAVSEFAAAVVPTHTDKAAIDSLKNSGIEVFKYKKNDEQSRIKAVEKAAKKSEVLFQTGRDKVRGWVNISRDGIKRTFQVMLTEHADTSTKIHELSHTYFEMLGDLSKAEDTPKQMRDDWKRALKFLEVDSVDQITAEHKERWARAWEAYMLRGKAPSRALVPTFQRFRIWLMRIYRTVKALDVELNDEIVGVFDRMLATDEEIESMQLTMGMAEPMFSSAEQAGMSEKEYARYKRKFEEDIEKKRLRLQSEMADTLQALMTTEWRKEVKSHRKAATAEYDARQDQRAWRYLRHGQVTNQEGQVITELSDKSQGKLNKRLVLKLLRRGSEAERKLRGRLLQKGGEDPAVVAQDLGFRDAKSMFDAIVARPDKQQWVRDRAEEMASENHPELALEAQRIRELAASVYHEEGTSDSLIKEWQVLRVKNGLAGDPPADAVREAAKDIVSDMGIRRLSISTALNRERKATERAIAAAARGDFREAERAKEESVLAHFVFRELDKARKEREQFEKLIKKLRTNKYRGKFGQAGQEFLDAADAILESVGAKPVPSQSVLDERADILEAIAMLNDEGLEAGFETGRLAMLVADPQDWKNRTVDEVRVLNAALSQMYAAAREANTVIVDGQRIAVQNLATAIATDAEARKDKGLEPGSTSAKRLRGDPKTQRPGMMQAIDASMVDPEELALQLGPTAHRVLWDEGYLVAREKERKLTEEVTKIIVDLWEKLPKKLQKQRYDRLLDLEGVPMSNELGREASIRDRQWMWMVALNMGNTSNRERLLGGYQWDEGQVMAWLDRNMTREEWEFVQGVWSLLDKKLFPVMAAAYKEVNGIDPPKIEASPIATKHGVFEGGYFPAKYDPIASQLGERQDDETVSRLYDTGARATLIKGFTKERAKKFSDVVNLQWQVVPSHISSVIHFATHDRFVRNADKILRAKPVTDAINRRVGLKHAAHFQPWLKSVASWASDSIPKELEGPMGFLFKVRSRFVLSTLGYSLTVAAGDLTNPLVAMAAGDIRMRHLARAMISVVGDAVPGRIRKDRTESLEKSRELKFRAKNQATLLQKHLGFIGKKGARGKTSQLIDGARETAWKLFEATDALSSQIIWKAAYEQRISEGLSESEAVNRADLVVRQNLPSYNAAQQPAILRDKRGLSSIIVFYSYFSKLYNVNRRMFLNMSAPEAAARSLAVILVANVFAELLSGRGPEEDEETEEYLLRKVLGGPFMLLPIIGQIGEEGAGWLSSYIFHGELKHRRFSVRGSPFASAAERLYKASKNVINEDRPNDQRIWDFLEGIGVFTGLPVGTSQIMRTGRFLTSDEGLTEELDEGDVAGAAQGLIFGEREFQPSNILTPFTQE